MKRISRDRRAAIVALVAAWDGAKRVVIDVGADHGHVAHALGAIASERGPGRTGRTDVPWAIADGLAGFRPADVAVIAGMGFRTIAGILERGPQPACAVLHCPDDPQSLRLWLGAHGWRIDDETLAREGKRFAEVIRAVPGIERHEGEALALGPILLSRGHPLLRPHLLRMRDRWRVLQGATAGHQADKHDAACRRVQAIEQALANMR